MPLLLRRAAAAKAQAERLGALEAQGSIVKRGATGSTMFKPFTDGVTWPQELVDFHDSRRRGRSTPKPKRITKVRLTHPCTEVQKATIEI
jgi:hypothetical protein